MKPKKPKYGALRFSDRPQARPATLAIVFAWLMGAALIGGTFLPFLGCATIRKGTEHVKESAIECADVAVDAASREAMELILPAFLCGRYAKTGDEMKACAVDTMKLLYSEASPEVQACVKAKALDILGIDMTEAP